MRKKDGPTRALLSEAVSRSGRTKVDIAKDLGVSHAYIHQMISGRSPIPIRIAAKLKLVLRMEDADYLELIRARVEETPGLAELIDEIVRWWTPVCSEKGNEGAEV